MRMIYCLGVLLSAALAPIMASGDSVALRYHCSGGAQLRANTNLTTLNQVLASSPTIAFRQLAQEQMSSLLSQSWRLGSNSAPLIEPLLASFLQDESLGALGAHDSNGVDFVLAVHMNAQRSQSWQDALGKAFGERSEKFTSEGFAGRRWSAGPPGSFWMVPARDWILLGRGNGLGTVQTEYLQEIARDGRPAVSLATNWLEADLDLNLLADALPEWAKLLKPGQIHISVAPNADTLEIKGRLNYAEAVPWKAEPWQQPKELVRNPLVTFTAGQDVAAFLNLSPQFANFHDNPLTNQFFAWANGQMPFQSYATWPASDPTNAMKKLSTEMQSAFNPILHEINRTQLLWQPDVDRLVWSDLRVVAPAITPARDDNRDFLLLSLFPLTPQIQSAPEKPWSQLDGRTNLVYYDWEVTGRRLREVRMLIEMLGYRQDARTDEDLNAQVVKDNFLGGMGTAIGQTVTEITRPAPNELSIVRQGPLGLTGVEMVLLSNWFATAGPR